MFQYASNHQKRKASHGVKNSQDLTPINLAAKLGRKDLFEKMLELRTIVNILFKQTNFFVIGLIFDIKKAISREKFFFYFAFLKFKIFLLYIFS